MTFSRRFFAKASLAALGASALPLSAPRAATASTTRNLIVLLVPGGWDTSYVLDPKPGSAAVDTPTDGDVTLYGDLPIFTSPQRPSVAAFFERYGAGTAVVNGILVQSLNHPECSKRLLTGTQSDANPDVGAIVAYELGRDQPAPYLVLGPTAYSGPLASIATRVGTVTQIRSLLSDQAVLPKDAAYDLAPRFVPSGGEGAIIRDYVEARARRYEAVVGQHGYNGARLEDFLDSVARSESLREFKAGFGESLDFSLLLAQQIALGLDAIQAGLAHSLHLEQTFASWDTHQGNDRQSDLNEALYADLTLLCDELTTRPGRASGKTMWDETVVAVVSEMGRTPKLNGQGGKDHWPVTSAMLLGGGVAGGRVYGATDDALQAAHVDLHAGTADPSGGPLLYSSFCAGLLAAVGVGPEAHYPGVEVFDAFMA
ncbi:MAG: DUF1501 domain-containing protein [Myxococcales bacterium]|nr:DUF1501 domain-containing protein [Myxococcales bacterium]